MGAQDKHNTEMKSEDAVTYHLVEAEEVMNSNATKARIAKNPKKGKSHWMHLPLSIGCSSQYESRVEHHRAKKSASDPGMYGSNGEHRPFRPNNRRNRRPRDGQNSKKWKSWDKNYYEADGAPVEYDANGMYVDGVFVPNPDSRITAQWAKSQIEFYFSSDNLVRDMFLRQHMDAEGYVPLAFVGSFQAVFSLHQDYPTLFDAMRNSEILELDEMNEKIRLRDGWQKWLWPNPDGSYGAPLYLNEYNPYVQHYYAEADYSGCMEEGLQAVAA